MEKDAKSHAFDACRLQMGLSRSRLRELGLSRLVNRGYGRRRTNRQDAIVTPDRQTAIAARAHQIWEEVGHPHGQDVQHWQQAEREHDEVEARAAAVEQFTNEAVEIVPAKATRKRVAKVVGDEGEVPVAPVRKVRTIRKAPVSTPLN